MNMSVLTLQEYEFEKQFNENEAIQWMQENWKKSFLFSALYAAFIFGGRHLMNKRAKFELRKPLVLWSLTLAVFRWVFLQFPNAVHPFHQTWLKEAN
uniref:Elongation of very long chain fatty acids protein n=1 Tax=Ursus americanus TaxID=9643 RepID=A0A452Q9L8_URSAM